MLTRPNPDDILEGIQIALQRDVLPECTSERAQMTITIANALLQMAREMVPVQHQYLAEEYNQYKHVLSDMAAELGEIPGPEADRFRARAAEFAAQPDLPTIPPLKELVALHDAVKTAVEENIRDADVLIREGCTAAEDALTLARAVMGPQIARDFGTLVVGAGMVGRG